MLLASAPNLFKYQSGRVVALGRVMLASLFLVSIWLDRTQSGAAAQRSYILLLVYITFALALALATWRNWWLDARLALPAHFVDMAVFMGIVFSTNIYTSPFFVFFLLPLLAAAIRWGWRATALTAAGLILLYLGAGLLVGGGEAFEAQRFIIRSGNLMFLSALLIWFGIHQRFTQLFFHVDELHNGLPVEADLLVQTLRISMKAAEAGSGALLLRADSDLDYEGPCMRNGVPGCGSVEQPLISQAALGQLLFNLPGNRALADHARGRFRFCKASDVIAADDLSELGAAEGLIAEVRSGTRQGWLVLWDMAELSTDYLLVGRELGQAVGAVLDRAALLVAIEEGAAARTRLSLARDVHDSVVQFLAGASFRVEAVMRASRSGMKIDRDLEELKRLLVNEQGEIRGFISALRRDRKLELADAVEELRALAKRLSQQWAVDCRVGATADSAAIPIRLQLDVQHLLREAVANAVRHGQADRVDIGIGVDQGQLRLEVRDNGSGFSPASAAVQPWSLKERVERAQGSLDVSSEAGQTNLTIRLPLTGGNG
ncbi:MAG TPA: ATP-binding protein [Sphingomicrobium sp.]|nr:ATP-binding protein [Sphingomicrobium sp.]